ncbi:gliding motility-associated C-terminal domain-containing protein [Lacinutrix sp. 5H-3-7-4]|uniref:T9SS type B sorting domain-containing protein n=1 Tax=Lacinutrix sp. (strain 5H-3-7-4) TaxID=983544 RepID=UPI000211467D|nr:gliding motility-associated C-terminal domain-containing protein [Lacinutrix sp. 5H-3-7-4]AEH01005.1 conserved repeat domain protein [Lacinutrix sp. 5H-3-7-4]
MKKVTLPNFKKSNPFLFIITFILLISFTKGYSQCDITAISTSMISACNNGGTTPDPSDDTFTADITVLFDAAPATGTLQISGDSGVEFVDVTTFAAGQTSYTFSTITMSADGTSIDITAEFLGDATCTFSFNEPSAGLAPASCSPDCIISDISTSNISACNNNGTPQDPSDDFFTADITVTYSNPPTSGTLDVTGDAIISQGFGGLNSATSHTFPSVQMVADGSPIDLTANFSDSSCPLNVPAAGNAPASCSMDCSIDNIELVVDSNSICNNNGTIGDDTDDFFTYDIIVTYTNLPPTGNLTLTTPTGSIDVPVGGVDSSTSHTFVGIQSPANGNDIDLTAAFSANVACTVTIPSVLTAPGQCSTPVGDGGLTLSKSHCDWGYTTTDTYIINYTGTLVNNGANPVYNVSITDDLGAAFGSDSYIIGFDSRTVGPAINGWSLNGGFNGTTDEELLNADVLNELDPGESISYSFCVEINAVDALDGATITNTISATANDTVLGDAYQVNATDGELFQQNLAILSAGLEVSDPTPTVNTDGTADFFYTVTLRNNGSGIATDVQYVDAFDHLFSNGIPINTLNVVTLSGSLTANDDPTSGFDGGSGLAGTSTNLLDPGQNMAPGETASFRIELNVGPTSNQTTRNTQGVFSGTDASLQTVSEATRRNTTANHDDTQCFCEQTPVRLVFTPIPIITKTITNNDPAGTLGNRDVTFQIEIENDAASPVDLFNLQITDNIEAMCPGNIVNVSSPVITSSTALVDPTIDPAYTGQGLNDVFLNNTGQLRPGDRVIVEIEVEITLPCTGQNTATFSATDPNGTAVTPVSSSVQINNPPEAEDNTYNTNVDTQITIDPLDNDSDPDSDPIIISEVDGIPITEGGAPVVLSDDTIVEYINGELIVTPPLGSSSPISFPYVVQDSLGNQDTANIFITVNTCTVAVISLTNISSCDSNGTSGDTSDDTFVADVVVEYTFPPGSGNLDLTGAGINTFVPVSGLDSATQHTFSGLTFSADGADVILTATFDNPSGCTDTQNAGTAPASCSVAQADVGITKTLNETGPFAPGDTVSWNIVVSNLGTDLATNVFVTDTPTNVTITNVNGGGCVTFPCNVGDILPNSPFSDVTIVVTGTIDAPGSFTNIASVSANEVDSNSANDTDDGTDGNNDGIAVGEADLVTVKTLSSADTTPAEGDTVTFTITVTNNGPDDATNVSLADTIPTELTATTNNGNTSGDQSSTYSAPNWTIPFIGSGQFVTLTIEGTVNAGEDGNVITNTTTAATTADQTDPTTAGNDLTESVTVDGCIDTDGDGDCDSTDPDPANPCVFTAGSVADTSNATWQTADCDGDGDPNGSDPDPLNPCVVSGTPTIPASTDPNYSIWAAEDCDGDGVINDQEVTDTTDPFDPCEYIQTNQDYTVTTTEFQNTDCDGDGVTNANEIDPDGNGEDDGNGTDPLDPCDYEPLLVTETQTGAWILADCDGDGDPNGSDPNPEDPCDFSSGTATPSNPGTPGSSEQAAYDLWAAADCDGDGDPNGTDPDPQDPCVFTVGSTADTSNPIWQAADCDGDGETNGTENDNGSDPTDPCSVSGAPTIPATSDSNYSVWASADCDGDGETNGEEIMNNTDPFDPCSVTNTTIPTNPGTPGSSEQAAYDVWAAADCDGDGDSNGTDPDPQDPCVFTAGSTADTSNPIWQSADCDGDGDSNGTDPDPQDPCVFTAGSTADTSNPIWQSADCDGDGDPNGTDPDPQDPCVFTVGSTADTSNPIWQAADCDGDGETNGTENDNGSDPTDPCSVSGAPTIPATSDSNYSVWASADCDGDGETNGEEIMNNTDPFDPCSVTNTTIPTNPGTPGSSEQAAYDVWAAADCDGDGDSNGTDPDPQDPCVFTAGSTADTSNPIWQSADCDGDGDSNGTDPDPQDPCVFTAGSTADTSNPIWQSADCDGDGDPNGTDPEPLDPCVFTAGSVGDTSNPVWADADCDGDGETNETDPDPYDPCVGGNLANVDLSDITSDWYTADCDGDGVINGTEVDPDMDGTAGPDGTDPTDPCDYNESDITVTQTGDWTTADCDGDGDPNGTDPEPLDPCVFTAGSVGDTSNPVWADADCDGDGETNATDPDPLDPCVGGNLANVDLSDITSDWYTADCDGDGVINGTEVDPDMDGTAGPDGTDPTDPCDYNESDVTVTPSGDWTTADCDGDGNPNGTDSDPLDPCVDADITMVDLNDTTSDWYLADCDGDGVINGTEVDPDGDGIVGPNDTDPNDPCDYDGSIQDINNTSTTWLGIDCDGDGVSNGTEINDGTDPLDTCSYLESSQDISIVTAEWEDADCDGDGEPNSTDTDPFDPCAGDTDITTNPQPTDPNYEVWAAADCDGDGSLNENDISPYDPCVGGNLANVDLSDNTSDWYTVDCDGDGVINGTEVDPDMDGIAGPNGTDINDPCDYNAEDVTETQTGDWLLEDCDSDGNPNGTDSDPLDPCVDADITMVDLNDTTSDWYISDCDGDGVINGTEVDPDGDGTEGPNDTDPNDPCDYDASIQDITSTSTTWLGMDCDGDGVSNGTEINDGTNPLDSCDYLESSQDITIVTTEWQDDDCDGDGVTNGTEVIDGTDVLDPCDFNPLSQDVTTVSSEWENLDCDGDGVTNGTEVIDGTDVLDPCDFIVTSQDTTPTTIWENADCDGDGVTNGDEVIDGTSPLDPCEFMLENTTVPQTPEWEALDCDGDGVTNGTEVVDGTDPLNECDLIVSSQDTTPTPEWEALDCDGDGVTNGDEVNDGTDPTDSCDFVLSSQTLPTSGEFMNADCDGDGVTNGDEVLDGTDPNDLCDFMVSSQTVTPSTEWNNIDCDGDGVLNDQEILDGTDPTDPCDFDPDSQDISIITMDFDDLDCDGDGVTNGDEIDDGTNPDEPCDFVLENQTETPSVEWNALDCDGDGVTNEDEILDGTDPLDNCSLIITSQTSIGDTEFNNGDCDGDGVTNGDEILDNTNPFDLCDFILASQTITPTLEWSNGDCDGDGVTNEDEVLDGTDPNNACDFDFESQDIDTVSDNWLNADCDCDGAGDGFSNGEELSDNNNNGIPDYAECNNGNPDAEDGLNIFDIMTPNGDGDNDVFVISGIENYPNNTLQIYNRWGVEVYNVDGYGSGNNFFRGVSEGRVTIKKDENLPVGTYYYVLTYVNDDGKTIQKAGPLYINRK